MNHSCFHFNALTADQSDVLIARLSEMGFTGFEEKDPRDLLAYYAGENIPEDVHEKLATLGLSYSVSIIPDINWNEEWEQNFQPITIPDAAGKPFVHIRAGFHPPNQEAAHELVITPKMSFGTGHHPTTWLVVQAMAEFDFNNKTVIDFGTGTGVLAILAAKMGAKQVVAIDHDDWCIENARENFEANNTTDIILEKADQLSGKPADIILANINLNVIRENLNTLFRLCKKEGIIVLSGMLKSDEAALRDLLKAHHVIPQIQFKNNWLVAVINLD